MSTWKIDKAHSEVQFKVKHMVISTISGVFNEFDGQLNTEEDNLDNANIHLSIDVQSIDTRNESRDGHLKSDDFFSANNFPKIEIKVENITKESDEEYTLHSKVKIKDVEKDIQFNALFGGVIIDPYGQTRMGLEITGKLNRQDFGLAWNATTEAGGLIVSNDVRLIGNLEFTKA